MRRSWRDLSTFYTLWLFVLLLSVPCAAWAGPGGIIKDVAATPVGRWLLAIAAILLSPIIIYYWIKSEIHYRRTRRDLERLAALYPQYRWLDIKDRVTVAYQWVWSAWSQQKMELADDYTTAWYMQNQQMLLDDWEKQGVENVCRVDSITRIMPLFVQHSEAAGGEGSRLVVEIMANVVDYLVDKQTSNVVKGDQEVGLQGTIWTLLWQDGAWRLNLIEPSAMELDYLKMPNVLPATLTPNSSRV